MSRAYEDIVEKLKTNVYKTNLKTRKANRNMLFKTRARLTQKIEKGESKQVKGDQAKVDKITELLAAMNALGGEELAPVAAAKAPTPKAAKAPTPKAVKAPTPKAVKAPTPKVEKAPTPSPKAKSYDKHTEQVAQAIISDIFRTMNTLSKKELEDVIKYFSDRYYNDGISLITDENYDRLAQLLKTKYGEVLGVGAEVIKNKVKLPYFMGSMDKIKPDKNNLTSWKLRYPGKVCISDKLDGISGLYIKDGQKRELFTRGDGTIGQDIKHMISHIQVGDCAGLDRCVVRGELIVSKANYDKVKEGKRGARQMVSGLANQKTLTAERIALMNLIHFVAYEVIVPEGLSPSQQFELLDKQSTFHSARWEVKDDVSIESLSELLTKRKETAKYEIDGIIVAHDKVYPRQMGNPDHAFAFKMSFADQQATTEVLNVAWEASKDGFLKPTVQFEPININGVIIQYATGFNAQFIHNNGIGPGAFLDIIRSGDVIPYIKAVQQPAPGGPQMPTLAWHWNETHVDAVLDDIAANPDVMKRILLNFADSLHIGFCGEGNISKLFTAGIKTIPQMVKVTEAQLLQEFGKKSAQKLLDSIKEATQKATISDWAVGSGVFGRSAGTKRLQAALELVPKSLEAPAGLAQQVAALNGWSKDSAQGFVDNLPAFKRFVDEVGAKPHTPTPVVKPTEGKLKDQVVLFTGFHPKDLEALVVAQAGTLADALSKKVTMLVIKDASVANEKTKKAAALTIPILTEMEFRAKFT
jgi:NAD-dependent DNA ligase